MTRQKPRVTVLGVLAALALLSVLAAVGAIRHILAGSTNELFSTRADVTVPSLLGLTEEQAAAAAADAGLHVVWRQGYSAGYAAGTVCGQRPRAGRTVKQGQQLTLTASRGVPMYPVPDLLRQPQRAASTALREAGFGVTVEFVTDGTLEPYIVLRTEPAPGALCEAGALVKLVVVRPVPDPYRPVPALTGLTVQEARARLDASDLAARVTGDWLHGTVTAQDPDPGTLLRVGSGVRLYVQ